MSKKSLMISMLGLVGLMGPASASTVIYCNQSAVCGSNNETAFNTVATTDGLDFGSGFESFLSNGDYTAGLTSADSITGLDFYAYNNTTQDGVTVTGNVLQQNVYGGNTSIETVLPTGLIYAYAFNISVASGSAFPCIELISGPPVTGGACNNQLNISSSSDTEFVGVISTTPLTDVFVGTYSGSPGDLQIKDFELGQAQTPEVSTLLLIGTGLITLRLVHRRRTRRAV